MPSRADRVCALELWVLSYLGVLIAVSYLSPKATAIHTPLAVSSIAVITSIVVAEIAVPRLGVPRSASGTRRAMLYAAALVTGVMLDYAVMPDPVGPRGFRIAMFALFGLPVFGWLFRHLVRNGLLKRENPAQIVVAACGLVLLLLYVSTTLLTSVV